MSDDRSDKERSILCGIQALTEMRLRPETTERFREEADVAIDVLREQLATEQAKESKAPDTPR